MRISDWSSDVCSSDLQGLTGRTGGPFSLWGLSGCPAYQTRSHRAKSRCPSAWRYGDGCLDFARHERTRGRLKFSIPPRDARLCLGAPALLSAADNGQHDRRSSPFRTRSRHDRYPVRQRAVRTLSRLSTVDDHRALAPRSARRADARLPPPAVGDARQSDESRGGKAVVNNLKSRGSPSHNKKKYKIK